jgi:hypothetical protein
MRRFMFVLVKYLFISCAVMIGDCDDVIAAEGCDPVVEKAQQSRAAAKVAYDVAITEEHIQKPDSVMSMTCMNNLAGIAASGAAGGGGTIFSGDFISASPSGNAGGLRATVQDALQTFYTAYADAMGADSGIVDYTQTALVNNPACSETQDLWTEVKQGGVEQGVPNATLTDLMNGTMPLGANTDFVSDWGVSNGTDNLFTNYRNDVNAQPPPWNPTFVQTNSFCQMMMTANIPGAACP